MCWRSIWKGFFGERGEGTKRLPNYESEKYGNYRVNVVSLYYSENTDTIGAIICGLAGLFYGFSDVSEQWVNVIQKKEYVMEMIEKAGK